MKKMSDVRFTIIDPANKILSTTDIPRDQLRTNTDLIRILCGTTHIPISIIDSRSNQVIVQTVLKE
jgi:hypothetical protein